MLKPTVEVEERKVLMVETGGNWWVLSIYTQAAGLPCSTQILLSAGSPMEAL